MEPQHKQMRTYAVLVQQSVDKELSRLINSVEKEQPDFKGENFIKPTVDQITGR